MSLTERYRGQRLLVTGTTGFLGKVLLEKLLYSLSHVERIYVLIRGKKGSDILERFKKEIVSSPCFDRLRHIHQHHFDEFIQAKVKPIQGDLQKHRVGLSDFDYNEIVQNCTIIINCAASIDFNARLDQAVDSNIRGSLRMLQLARSTKNLLIFTHISTCYVNCDLKGLIREEIYDKPIDPEEEFATLEKMELKEMIMRSDAIVGDYPNTYTYTKGLCERLMQRRKKDLPVCIVRPAIINTSYREPFPGWLDSIAAAAAFYLFVGLGIIKVIDGDSSKIGDTVPVDVVVANIIAATAYNFKNSKLSIYHVGTSDRNPITWGECRDTVTTFWNSNVSQSRVSRSQLLFTQNIINIKLKRWQRRLPIWLYSKAAPWLGKQHVKNAQKMQKTISRGDEVLKIFRFFIHNEWIYECRNVKQLSDFLIAEEKKDYLIDSADIDTKQFLIYNNYGLQKYILKENIEMPTPANSNLLGIQEKGSYFSDIKWVMKTDLSFNKKRSDENIKTKILSSTRVLRAIDEEALRRVENKNLKIEDVKLAVQREAVRMVEETVGQLRLPVVRFMAWTLHKIFKNIYEKVNINMDMFEQLKEIEQSRNIPIVLLPTHRSYIDFLIVSYIFFVYKIKLPYIVSDEALMNAYLLPFLIRSSGAFFYRKKTYATSRLYRVIFNKYIESLLRQGKNLEFFIEGTRSRTGKILSPQRQILNVLIDTVINGKLDDICLVPLTINYEKVLQGDTFPNELLGEEKVEESLLRIIKAIPLLNVNFGRVYVQICSPIFLKSFQDDHKKLRESLNKPKESFRQSLSIALSSQIILRMTEKVVIMSTGIVSSVLLMYRKGVSEQMLIKTVNWISKYILNKGYKIGGMNENSSTIAVRNAIGYLREVTTKTKKNIFELQISARNQFQKILMLSYYRNTIMHVFLPQAFVGCVMASFGHQLNSKEGVKFSRVHEESVFLTNLLREQYNVRYDIKEQDKFLLVVARMVQNHILERKEDKLLIHPLANNMIALHCSLLRSLIECYWACVVYIITICKSQGQKHQVASLQKFFDTVQWFMESLYDEKVIQHYEACSLESIKNAFQTYEKQNIIKISQGAKKVDASVEVIVKIDTLQNTESNLKFFLKSLYHNSVLSPMDVAKSSLIGATISRL